MAPLTEHPIKLVSHKTGISQHVLRIWERRYKAVTPSRSSTQRRYYSEEDIQRLKLLKKLTGEGHRIGQVAELPLDELKDLVERLHRSASLAAPSFTTENLLENCLRAISQLDVHGLDVCLAQGSVLMSPLTLIQEVIQPLL